MRETFAYGYKVMYESEVAPRLKYPIALRAFRRVLDLDESHTEAAAEKERIEKIYESMGRPIPE